MSEVNTPTVESVPFDFRQTAQVSPAQLTALEAAQEALVRSLSSSLSLFLRSDVSGTIVGIEQTSFAAMAERLTSPACLAFFTIEPYEGYALLEVGQALLAPILDCVLGGNGKIDFGLDREITDIEESMLDGFFQIVAQELRETWQVVAPIQFRFDAIETSPAVSNRMAPSDGLVVMAMELKVDEKSGPLSLAIPAATLKLLRQAAEPSTAPRKPSPAEPQSAIREKLTAALEIDLECALIGSTLRLRDLLQLKAGDVIDTGIACDGAATALLNGIPKFRGEVTTESGKQALVIQSAFENPAA